MTAPPGPATALPDHPPFPVLDNVAKAYCDIAANAGVVVRIVGSWCLLLALSFAAAYFLLPEQSASQGSAQSWGGALAIFIICLFAVAMASIAVGWHRFLLLGERPPVVYLRISAQVGGYLFAWIIIVLQIMVMAIALLGVTTPLILAADYLGSEANQVMRVSINWMITAFFYLVIPRFLVALPNVAIGNPLSMGDALNRTRGSTWRLFAACFLTTLPFMIVGEAGSLVPDAAVQVTGTYPWLVFGMFILPVSMLAGVGLLSHAHRHFSPR